MFKINYLYDFLFGFFCYLCRVVFKVCYVARVWAPFRAFVSGSAGLTPVISPRLQPSTAPSALRTAGRLSPARNTMVNSCVSGWHRRQQKVCYVARGWAPFRAFVSGSAGLTPVISPRLQPSTAPSALRTAGRLSPARNTMVNSCVSGWHRRQQKVTMVNSCASGWRNSRSKVIPQRGTGARQGERGGVVCGLTLRCACVHRH